MFNHLEIIEDFQNNPHYSLKANIAHKPKNLGFYKFTYSNKLNIYPTEYKLNNTFKLNINRDDYCEFKNESNSLVLTMNLKTNKISKSSEFNHNITFDKTTKEFTHYNIGFKTPDYGNFSYSISKKHEHSHSKFKYSLKNILDFSNLTVILNLFSLLVFRIARN
jgi:hypothetical protein